MNQEWQDRVYVKSSPIQGLGVFARRNFATGETILVRDERPVTPDSPLDPSQGELEQHCDWLEGGRQVYLGFPARFINHGCEANSFVRFEGGAGQVVALKPIRAHEEVVNHYGVNLSDGMAWKCNCRSPRCLGVVPGDFFALPEAVKLELSPLLAEWFVREHRPEYDAFLRSAGLDEAHLK